MFVEEFAYKLVKKLIKMLIQNYLELKFIGP